MSTDLCGSSRRHFPQRACRSRVPLERTGGRGRRSEWTPTGSGPHWTGKAHAGWAGGVATTHASTHERGPTSESTSSAPARPAFRAAEGSDRRSGVHESGLLPETPAVRPRRTMQSTADQGPAPPTPPASGERQGLFEYAMGARRRESCVSPAVDIAAREPKREVIEHLSDSRYNIDSRSPTRPGQDLSVVGHEDALIPRPR